MTALLVTLVSSLIFCFFLTPVVRAYARRVGLIDHPDGKRKIHSKRIPVAGGLAVLVAFWGALSVPFMASHHVGADLRNQQAFLLGLFLATIVICFVGVVDDSHSLRGRHKLLGQLVAIGIVMSCGLSVERVQLFGWQWELGVLSVPFTVLWLLGAINSLNLLDGMDGMLSCVGVIISLAIAGMAVLGDQWAGACLAVALGGALLGFLRYNFPPATIFLGDCGSMLIGLVVGVLAIRSSLKGPATIAFAAPAAMLTIPAFDTVAAIVRRKLTGRSIYATDRAHLHHCLIERGLSTKSVLLWVSISCLVTALGALASLALRNESLALLAGSAVVAIYVATRIFGYGEFLLVKNRLVTLLASFLQLRPQGMPHQEEVHLQGSANWAALWRDLIACAHRQKITKMSLVVNVPAIHEGYHACWEHPRAGLENTDLWRVEIPLFARGQNVGRLEVVGPPNRGAVCLKIAAMETLLEAVEEVVSERRQDIVIPLPAPAPTANTHRLTPEKVCTG